MEQQFRKIGEKSSVGLDSIEWNVTLNNCLLGRVKSMIKGKSRVIVQDKNRTKEHMGD